MLIPLYIPKRFYNSCLRVKTYFGTDIESDIVGKFRVGLQICKNHSKQANETWEHSWKKNYSKKVKKAISKESGRAQLIL